MYHPYTTHGGVRSCFLLLPIQTQFTIYTNALHNAQPLSFYSFYKWTGLRSNLILKIGNIYEAFILVIKL